MSTTPAVASVLVIPCVWTVSNSTVQWMVSASVDGCLQTLLKIPVLAMIPTVYPIPPSVCLAPLAIPVAMVLGPCVVTECTRELPFLSVCWVALPATPVWIKSRLRARLEPLRWRGCAKRVKRVRGLHQEVLVALLVGKDTNALNTPLRIPVKLPPPRVPRGITLRLETQLVVLAHLAPGRLPKIGSVSPAPLGLPVVWVYK
jgi:hypothetical protein